MTLAQSAATSLWFLPFALPIAIWVAWSDMARMKIPNKAVAALFLVYAVVGLVALPLEEYLWRYTHLVVVLVVGFFANAVRALGAGDAKFAAAMAPFIALPDAVTFVYLFAVVLLAGFAVHRLARATPAIRRRTPDWESWTRKDFPMGLCLGSALAIYLAAGVIWGS